MAAQTFIAIAELHPNIYHPKVAGVIIWKSDVKSFPDRKNIGSDRFTFGFTIRDSPDFFINVAAWGNDGYINGLSSSFCIGDCVTIENPLISNKDPEKGERFCPTTPSRYRLLLTEAHSQVCLCADMDTADRLLPLIHIPVKDVRDFYSLGDIVANGQKMDGTMINILAAVKSIGEPKHFTTSEGRKGQRQEVKLFDDSAPSFSLICWDREVIQLMQSLNPGETVLFIADAKISFDSFRKGMAATVNYKTVITVNPDTREASLLFRYAKEAIESGALDEDEKPEDIPVDSITDVYTVDQLKQKGCDTSEPFFGITYSFMSKLNLDLSVSKVIKMWCSRCKFQVSEDAQVCTNNLCPARDEPFSTTTGFNLMVDFTDHTGTLQACTLRSPVAENMLGCTPEEFFSLTEDERTALKWKFLLERCKIYVKIIPSTKMRTGIKGIVLACLLADPGEVKQHMSALLQQLG
ncbi:meiosis-specific with OB domain-containing protein isoform X2 [Betta splendens]|uniref:Meiosis-specific with OB domain-containing protein isoform X2 n=1 Tax=Betta splendens TaxID=158456 RepID=A0A6P7LBB5_BETSP|nr:meiosis-specific with OB domain-containing protein isoform X2 [Betta splendens]XP_040924579.1 meiosis-specific with OB domain-containing protein isoform X2 [Betta splendens]